MPHRLSCVLLTHLKIGLGLSSPTGEDFGLYLLEDFASGPITWKSDLVRTTCVEVILPPQRGYPHMCHDYSDYKEARQHQKERVKDKPGRWE